MSYQIRDLRQQDWPTVSEIYQAGMDTNIATFQTECPSYTDFNQSHLPFCRFVILNGDHIIGWAALTPVSSRCVYRGVAEVSIYIDSLYKGKGIGTQLLNHLIEEAEKHDIWTLQSSILEDNVASIHLHKKCGFRLVGYRERIGKDRFCKWRNTVLMEKRSQSI